MIKSHFPTTVRREQRLMFGMVACAHSAALIALAGHAPNPRAENLTPITVALISAAPRALAKPPAPAAEASTPRVKAVQTKTSPTRSPQRRKTEPRSAPVAAPSLVAATAITANQRAEATPDSDPVLTASPAAPDPSPRNDARASSRASSRTADATAVQPARYDAAYLNNPPPAYPRLARRLGEQGKVVLRVLVTANGLPGKIELSASSGSGRLDDAALSAIAAWRFIPATADGRGVDAWVVVPVVFNLQGS